MGIEVASGFERKSTVPLDEGSVVADLTARDAIDAGIRYEGMIVYVTSEATNFQLIGGILDANWEELSGGGGGGGSGIGEWVQGDKAAPEKALISGRVVYKFIAGGGQSLYSSLEVPVTYSPGDQIKVRLSYFTPATSGTGLLLMVATLVNPGNDITSVLAPTRTSTNTAVTFSGTANILREVEIDLTDAIGEIDTLAVAAGASIALELLRSTDTSTEDLNVIINSCGEVYGD